MADAWETDILDSPAAPRKTRATWGTVLGLAALALVAGEAPARALAAAPGVVIMVRRAPFPSADSAAKAEALVRWNDDDPADDDACTESYAAVELRGLLRRCPGFGDRHVVIRDDGPLPGSGDVIVLGNVTGQPSLRRWLPGATPGTASREAYRIRAFPDHGRTIVVVCGAGRVGTLYGAYALLERLGVRFYGPADAETVFPRKAVSLPAFLDVASSPAFEVRGFWAWEPRGDPAFFRWMARRRMNLWSVAGPGVPTLRKLGIRLAGGGHRLQSDYLNPHAPAGPGRRGYFAAHPDWYGLHAGTRSDRIDGESGDNFCTSNPAAVAEFAKNVIASLAGGPLADADILNVWPLDGGRWCECDACRALGGPSDRALDLVRRLGAAVREARRRGVLHRDVTLSAAAYLESMPPPVRPARDAESDSSLMVTFFPYYRCYAHTLSDPACHEFNQRIAAAWAGWSQSPGRAYRGRVGLGEYYNVSWFKSLPLVFPHVMARDIAEAHDQGARWFSYMHVPTERWGSWRLNHLVLSEALWSPGFDVDSLIADYGARAYPSAASDMAVFHHQLEVASANIFAVELTVGGVFAPGRASRSRLTLRSVPVFPYAHLPALATARERNAAPAWGEIVQAMAAARSALLRARSASSVPGERWRLGEDERRFAYGELTFALYDRLLRLARADHGEPGIDTGRALLEADSLARRLVAVRDLVRVAGEHANARDGLDASHVAPAIGYFHDRFGSSRLSTRARPAGR